MPFSSSNVLNSILKSLFISIILFLFGCSSPRYLEEKKTGSGSTDIPVVRILLNEPSAGLEFELADDISVYAGEKEIIKKAGPGNKLVFVKKKDLILSYGKKEFKADYFLLKPAGDFTYNNKKINGDIKIISDKKKIYLLNSIPIEEYLKGVIPSEMPVGRGDEYFEALKAFAVCARTYTLQRISAGNNIFDVRTDVRDQVYGGSGRKHPVSDKAVDETSGLILSYGGKPATVFYSSTCGGKTEDVENVFGNTPYPYLRSIKDGDGPFCSASPRAEWEEIFSGSRIVDLLINSGRLKNENYFLEDIKVNSRFRSGRVNELELILKNSSENTSVKLYGNDIRFVLLTSGNRTLNSSNFDIFKKGDKYIFSGKGSGHGVGLCQWGALIQSTLGIRWTDILVHYFPGTSVMSWYD